MALQETVLIMTREPRDGAKREPDSVHYVQTVASDAEMEVVRRRTGRNTDKYALRVLIEGVLDGSIKPSKPEVAT